MQATQAQAATQRGGERGSLGAIHWAVGAAGALAVLIGGFMLAAWFSGAAARWSAAGNTITVKTNMALGLLLAGSALFLLGVCSQRRVCRWAGLAAAAVILLLGGLTLSEHLIGWDLGIDQLLAKELPGALATTSPNRVGVPGSTSLTLLGVALLLLGMGRRRIVPYLGLAILLINLVPAVGFLYGISQFFSMPATGIAWPTVLAMIGLGLGLVLACPEEGPMVMLLREDAGGRLLRSMLPMALLLPLVLGFLRVLGQHRGLYDTALGTGLLVLSLILIFSAMLWRNAVQLSRADRQQKQAEESLARSQKTLFELVERSPFGTYIVDSQFRIAQMNAGAQAGTFQNVRPVIGRDFAEAMHILWPEDVAAGVIAAFRHTLDTGEPYYSPRFMHSRHDVQAVEAYEWELHRMMLPDGQYGVICYYYDSTKLRTAEEALRQSEEQFRTLAETITNLAWWANADGYITWYNRRWYEYTGTTPEQMEGWGWQSVHDPQALPAVMERWQASIATGEPFDMTFPLRGADGVFRRFLTRIQPVKDSQGRVVRWFGTNTDVEDLKRAEEAQALLAAIVESSDDAILSKALDGTILTWNVGAQRLFGYRPEEIIGKSVALLLPPERVAEEEQIIARLQRGERIEHYETVRVAQNGRQIDASVTVSPLRDRDGKVVGASKIIHDITQRKQAEESLKRTAEELARSNQDLEQFAYVASHDLQEPLRMVTGYLELLNRRYKNTLDSDAREFIGFAVDGATRMSRLITDLLDYSRINTRGKSPEPVAMEGVLQCAVDNLQAAIRDSSAQVIHDPLPRVLGDASQLVQLMQNLVGNAIKFRSPDRPVQVHMGAEKKDNEWLFSVKDNGIGIDSQYAEKIFLIFQRLHGRGEYPGTGIGLAICRKIVERHGGRIWVQSQLGQGSTFFFTVRSPGASR